MIRVRGLGRRWAGQQGQLVQVQADSPLRAMDPRAKLALMLVLTSAVMLPQARMGLFVLGFLALLAATRLLSLAMRRVMRILPLLIVLFALDWAFVSLELALSVTLRMIVVVSVSTIYLSTTTPEEFRLAIETLGVPYRYAFALSAAFGALPMLQQEWRAITEAQRARGVSQTARSWRARLADWVALTVPAVVLTTRRAWSLTEAAHARGLGSPHRRPVRPLRLSASDVAVVAGAAVAIALLVSLR
jgi:energy-coupling factor transport system permease protein